MSDRVSSKTILLVEDEALISLAEAAMLRRNGYAVVCAASGEDAIQAARHPDVDLVLMDIDLGRGSMDGTQAAQAILRERQLPIVFLSSHIEPGIVEKTEAITSYGYVVKNSGETVLLASIRMAFRLHDAHSSRKEANRARVAIEAEHRRSQEDLLKIGRMARVGGWEVRLPDRTVSWSEVTKEIHEVPADYTPTLEQALSHYPGESGERIAAAVREAIDRGTGYELELDFVTATGRPLRVRTSGHVEFTEDGGGRLCGIIQDVTRIKELEEVEAADAKRKRALLELHGRHGLALEHLFDYILDASLELTGSEYSFFGLLDADESSMTIHAWSGGVMAECAVQGEPIRFPISGAGVWGDCVRRRTPVIYNDYDADIPSKKGVPAGHVPIRRFLGVPVVDGESIVAVAAVANKSDPYDQTDVESLRLLYEQAWIMVNRKRAEDLLRESEERLNVATALNSDYAYCHKLMEDGSLAPVWHVGSFDTITGYTPEELRDLGGWASLIHEEDVPLAANYVQNLLSGKPDTCVARIVTRQGETRWIEDRGRPWVDAATGEVIGTYGSARDITELRRVEFELRKQEALYRNLMENSIDAVYLLSREGSILNVNRVACDMTGYTREELLARTIDDVDPNYPSARFVEFWEHQPEGSTVLFETQHRRRDGSCFPVEVNGIFFVADGAKYLFGVARDLTERRRREEELRRIEWMLEPKRTAASDAYAPEYGDLSRFNDDGLILSTVGKERLGDLASDYLDRLETSAAVYEKNGDYALGMYSSGWCRLLDRASRRLCGTADDREALASRKWLCHESCWTHGSRRAIEVNGPVDVACNGGIRIYAVPVRANGKIVGSINFGYGDPPTDDATVRALAQAYGVGVNELRSAARAYQSRPPFVVDLAKRRLEKTALSIGQLVERAVAERQLTRALEEKEFLMKELNHRVKNNLMMISSLIDLKTTTEGRSADLADIRRHVDAIRIVHAHLRASQDVSRVDLGEYLNDLVANLFASAPTPPTRVPHIPNGIVVPTRMAVPVALIVNELATNAMKHASGGTDALEFSVSLNRDAQTAEGVLTVSNNGPPIPESVSLENPSTLGLRLISGLVEQLDGSITLERSPSPVFTIRFPLPDGPGANSPPGPVSSPAM